MPLVSIIIPVYGVEQHIEKCAISLFEQTLDDIEYIFVDDCTKDKSIEILQKVMEAYPHRCKQTKIISHSTNLGLPQARKTGIEAANGKYIAHCDSDDYVEKNMYQLLVNKAETEGFDIVVCDIYKTYLNKTNILKYFSKVPDNKDYIFNNLFSNTCLHNLVGLLCKRSLYQNEIEYPTNNIFEDLVFTFQLFHFGEKIGYLQLPLYHYIIHSSSISNTNSTKERIRHLTQTKANLDVCLSFINKNNIDKKYADLIRFFHNLNFKTVVRTKKQREEYSQYNYPPIKQGFLFKKNINLLLKIRLIILTLRLYKLYDILDRLAQRNPLLKNKVS